MFETITIKGQEYKLRLNAINTIMLEKSLGKNPLTIFFAMEKGNFPTLEEVIKLFHASLKCYQSETTYEKAINLYDDYIEDDGSLVELVEVLSNVVASAGYLPKDKTVDNTPIAIPKK